MLTYITSWGQFERASESLGCSSVIKKEALSAGSSKQGLKTSIVYRRIFKRRKKYFNQSLVTMLGVHS